MNSKGDVNSKRPMDGQGNIAAGVEGSNTQAYEDDSMHGKKVVSFFTVPDNKAAGIFNAADCLHYMKQGSAFVKLRTSGRQYKRHFYLDDQMRSIRWVSTSKRHTRAQVHITEIHDVRLGCSARSVSSLKRRHRLSRSPSLISSTAVSLPNQNQSMTQRQQTNCYNTLPIYPVSASLTRRNEPGMNLTSSTFTISYGPDFETLELLANSPEEANIWITGLKCLMTGAQDPQILEERQKPRDRWLMSVFNEADLTNSGYLTEHQVLRLVQSINPALTEAHIRQQWKEWDHHFRERRGRFDRMDFVNFYKKVSTRQEIYHLLIRVASGSELLSCDDLRNFLESEQGKVGISMNQCQKFIDFFEPSSENRRHGLMGIDGFTAFLLSRECDLFDSTHLEVCQDMSQPITHYYVAASHKTFLLEDQLTGPCSIEGYRRTLLSGCRYIEIETYDGHDGYPVVRRANSRPPGIPVQAVLETINMLAFQRSDYPLIISIESYNSIPQQIILANLLVTCFGQKLLLPSTEFFFTLGEMQLETEAQVGRDSNPSRKNSLTTVNLRQETSLYSDNGSHVRWPSPRDLIGRILLKGRRLPKGTFGQTSTDQTYRRNPYQLLQANMVAKELSDLFFFDCTDIVSSQTTERRRSNLAANLNFLRASNSTGWQNRFHTLTSFPVLVVGTHSEGDTNSRRSSKTTQEYPHASWGSDRSKLHTYHFLQLSEAEASKALGSYAGEMVQLTRNSLVEIIPSPSRADSSNINPVDVWAWGGQVVPLNYQTAGLIMDLATGFFARNGACGYVLKPALYRKISSFFTPNTDPTALKASPAPPDTNPQSFQLKILSAQQLPKPRGSVSKGDTIEPFVVVEMYGIPVDCAEQRTATAAAGSANGYNAIFNETFEFCVQLGSLALVRFLVLDDHAIGDDFIGQNTMPFDCLLSGYRHVRLRSDTGEPIPQATLFVHVTITSKKAQGAESKPQSGVLHRFRSRKRQRTQLKKVGNATFDDIFKSADVTLQQAIDLHDSLLTAFERFRNFCGETSTSMCMAQCIRSLSTRLQTACGSPEFWPLRMRIRPEDDLPHLELQPTSAYSGTSLSVFPSMSTLGESGTSRSRLSPAPSMQRSPSLILSTRSLFQRKQKRDARSVDEDVNSALSVDVHSTSTTAGNPEESIGEPSPLRAGRSRYPSTHSITSSLSSLSFGGVDKMRRAVSAFESFIELGKTLIKQGPYLRVKLEHSQKTALEAYTNFLENLKEPSTQQSHDSKSGKLPKLNDYSNLKSQSSRTISSDTRSASGNSLYWRKMSRVADAVTWNLRLLTGQAEQLSLTLAELTNWLRQAKETGQSTGLISSERSSTELDELTDKLDETSLLNEQYEGPPAALNEHKHIRDNLSSYSTTRPPRGHDTISSSRLDKLPPTIDNRKRENYYFPSRPRTSFRSEKEP